MSFRDSLGAYFTASTTTTPRPLPLFRSFLPWWLCSPAGFLPDVPPELIRKWFFARSELHAPRSHNFAGGPIEGGLRRVGIRAAGRGAACANAKVGWLWLCLRIRLSTKQFCAPVFDAGESRRVGAGYACGRLIYHDSTLVRFLMSVDGPSSFVGDSLVTGESVTNDLAVRSS
jgi:hypothetical protein